MNASQIDKKLEKFYQLEFEIPLLDPALRYYEARSLNRARMGVNVPEVSPPVPKGFEELEPQLDALTTTGSAAGKSKLSAARLSKKSMASLEEQKLKGKMLRSYARWINKDVEPPVQTTFMSKKAHWAKIISFPSPCIEIPVEPEWWRQLRDSMRSVIIMRLYYKEVALVKAIKPEHENTARASKTSKRASQLGKKPSIARQSMKRGSKAGKRQSKAGGRKSVAKRASKAGGRKSVAKRASKAGGRKSMARRQTNHKGSKGGKSKRTSTGKREEILLVRNLIAKIPVPAEITKWNVPFMGYTWDVKERCLAKRYPSIEKEKYAGGSFSKPATEKTDGSPEKRQSKGSVTGKRKSRASSVGKRQSKSGKRASKSTGGKRASKSPGKRASQAGKRASKAGGKRASQAGKRASKAGGPRKSRTSNAGGKRKSISKGTKGGKSGGSSAKEQLIRQPDILTCHVGIGLLRLGKEAPNVDKSRKSKAAARKSKAQRKSRASKSGRKSKSGAQRKSMQRKSMKRSSKVAKK